MQILAKEFNRSLAARDSGGHMNLFNSFPTSLPPISLLRISKQHANKPIRLHTLPLLSTNNRPTRRELTPRNLGPSTIGRVRVPQRDQPAADERVP